MVGQDLKQDLIDAGAQLVALLDQEGMQPDAAFWIYEPELQTWKLVLAEARVGTDGPRVAYKQIQKSLAKLPPQHRDSLPLEVISITRPDSPLIRLLRAAVKTGKGISGIRFKNNVVNGTLIEDAYIYRLT